eukprot:CAMPEP_0201509580 /NCGR_PEP_ID=MMETSP0161_2-20130828/2590_1 /ASSEMBLY_ACC=CAM_ASM_000251 /TAXON_ID=180227 /ORGANISM="Neoparamoeba aestuarina, Strain SoJaBio B1-5/56/2" /LENGTH=733 /DNA_ID=CAMNT_0047904573 /DNA_START=63 /DNA_END=2264 /DNA_ORIENTATION=-
MDLLRDRADVEMKVNPDDRVLTREELAGAFKWVGEGGVVLSQLTDTIDGEMLDNNPKVAAVCNYAVGYNNIDVAAATARDIPVTNTPGVLTDTTADLSWTLLMCAARRASESERYLRAGKYKGWAPELLVGSDVHHKTLGIVGMGRIGYAMAERGSKGFGMRVVYTDTEEKGYAKKEGFEYVENLEEMLEQSDFVSLHTVLSPETKHLMSDKQFKVMKKTAYLINASRGPVVDEPALVNALKGGEIAGCALDVFENEPEVHPGLLECENAVIVPHIGSATIETRTAMGVLAVTNSLAALDGKPLPNCVNPSADKNHKEEKKEKRDGANLPELSRNLSNLGTETAYTISNQAKAMAAAGKKIYPLHIGDFNLGIPEFTVKALDEAIKEGKVHYNPQMGVPEFRKSVAKYIADTRNLPGLTMDNVSVTPGGKPVIGKFLSAVMNPGDEVLMPSPGYPIYESQTNFLGGKPVPFSFTEEKDRFHLDTAQLRKLITPKTRVMIFNDHHNPTGYVATNEELEEVARIAVEHNLWVLTDEAYWDIFYGKERTCLAALPGMRDRTVILFTFSKTWGMTGWRLGAAVGPQNVIDMISKINSNQEACTNTFVQWAGISCLENPESKPYLNQLVERLKQRRDVLCAGINKMEPWLHCIVPESTFYCFVNVTKLMDKMGLKTVEEFRVKVLDETGVSFCTRDHFGSRLPHENQFYIRLAFSGISRTDINEAVEVLSKWVEKQIS